jgi:hypothetical protein
MTRAINWTLYAPQYHFAVGALALYVAVLATLIYRRLK